MAAMTTILTPYGMVDRKQMFTAPGHANDEVFYFQYKAPVLASSNASSVGLVDIIKATHDSSTAEHRTVPIRFGCRWSIPDHIVATDVGLARDLFREWVASDQFVAMTTTGVFAPTSV